MRPTLFPAAFWIATLFQVFAADAQSNLVPGPQQFSLAEEVVIARNDVLRDLLVRDPETVKIVIETIRRKRPPDANPSKAGKFRDVWRHPNVKDELKIDRERNPDLNLFFQRASPEAAYDLFQILKQAGGGTTAPAPR